MRNEFYYKNNFGESVRFGVSGIFADVNKLRDYSWSYTVTNYVASDFKRASVEKEIPVLFAFPTESQFNKARNNAFNVFERDIVAEKPGRIYLDGYYLECFIVKGDNADYQHTKKAAFSTFTILAPKPIWRKEIAYNFMAEQTTVSGLDFPFDFEFDYAASSGNGSVQNSAVENADLRIVFYGPCTNPNISIDGHEYEVDTSCESGEYIEVDTMAKTIIRYGTTGTKTNCYKYRNRDSYIFQTIGEGTHQVTWDGEFDFTLNVIESRGEPLWQ